MIGDLIRDDGVLFEVVFDGRQLLIAGGPPADAPVRSSVLAHRPVRDRRRERRAVCA